MILKDQGIIPSVNFHLWEPCNMCCKFCFARFQDVKQTVLPKGHLTKEEAINVVLRLAEFGFKKITFAGGEPTLCPWLNDLIATAHCAGMTTMVVTNGSMLTDDFLTYNQKALDWIAISIDSLNPITNILNGRAVVSKKAFGYEEYMSLAIKIKHYGFGLKINTVVNNLNYTEDMNEFIIQYSPARWKVFQVLPIIGQNDKHIDSMKITESQFDAFIANHNNASKHTVLVPESNNAMKGSYAMVDPAGRFYDNANGMHKYSKSILEIGCKFAIQQVDYDFAKFISRGGIYDWGIK